MKTNAEMIINEDGSTYNSEKDNRQTKIGKILRKTSIDELPQIVNILKGDMAWIGPRPALDFQITSYSEEEKEKYSVLPGVTGYTQAYFRNELSSHDERMKDVWYANNVSFLLDLKIVFKTIETVLHPSRVYRNRD
jgi:lipopolysaccharide/colanic/teichoic acid biosynthesis glycosyltransferase